MQEKELSSKIKNILIVLATVNGAAIIILVIIKIWMMFSENATQAIIEKFHNNQELICVSNRRIHINQGSYIVSLKRGWKIYDGNYVTKNDFIIKLKNCD